MSETLQGITVVIPQHNCWFETVACCSSLWRHHPGKIQTVIVDDGSDAKNRAYAMKYLSSRATILTQEHQGVTAAWNRGVAVVDTGVVVLLNNDAMTVRPWLAEMLSLLKFDKRGLAGADLRRDKYFRCADFQKLGIAGNGKLLQGWCLGFRKTTFEVVGPFDETMKLYWSDTDWQLRWMQSFACDTRDLRLMKPGLLRHRGQRSTRHLRERSMLWREDRARFLEKWVGVNVG